MNPSVIVEAIKTIDERFFKRNTAIIPNAATGKPIIRTIRSHNPINLSQNFLPTLKNVFKEVLFFSQISSAIPVAPEAMNDVEKSNAKNKIPPKIKRM